MSRRGGVRVAWEATTDVVVVGSGVAGMTTGQFCASSGLRVLIVSKGEPDAGSTTWAQGGVAVVDTADTTDGPVDSVADHLQDTLVAGAGLTDPVVAAAIVTEGPAAVGRLRLAGARFDADAAGRLSRTREGGHHADRIIHAGGDATGAEIQRALLAVPGSPTVVADHLALDVLRDDRGHAGGISVLAPDGTIGVIRGGAVVLATGGSGHLFGATTNPVVATGDGVAMALRAGAAVTDSEFVQFHPTALFTTPGARGHRPLVSEAVRGAGAVLIDGAGDRVMTGVHPLADLAPRDVVALAITRRMAENPGGIDDHVFLDATAIDDFRRRFPTITASCLTAGIDPCREPVPVAPAAHYQCGGVDVDLSGRTTVPGLYAVGEVARTGLHGANRLASNSLLEGLVMGERAGEQIVADHRPQPAGGRAGADPVLPRPAVADPARRALLQEDMSRHAGIGRTAAGLASITLPDNEFGPAGAVRPNHAAVETANLVLAARAMVQAATIRTESRGCHVRLDHPQRSLAWAQPITQRLIDDTLVVDELRTEVAS